MAQGTIRPLSERAFFMAGFSLFGLDALPFKIVIFATQFANLALVASIGARLTGLRWAGFFAAIFWVLNGSGIEPLGWSCVYNQVLCGFFLLLAFHFLLRYVETGERRYNLFQWAAFLLGFGALELNVVYPAIAAAYTCCCSAQGQRERAFPQHRCRCSPSPSRTRWCTTPRRRCRRPATTPCTSPAPCSARWADTGPGRSAPPSSTRPSYCRSGCCPWESPWSPPDCSGFWRGSCARARASPCSAWRGIWPLLAPVLPLRDHQTEYYVFLPVIGLCWLGGWAAVSGWRAGARGRAAAVTLAAIYALMMVPGLLATSEWNHDITMRVRNLVEGVAGVHERYPAKSILLEGVDTDLFWNGVLDRPFRLFGLDHIYLAPGSEKRIEAHPDLGNIDDYILPAAVVDQALKREELVVYDVRGPRLRNITDVYAALPRDSGGLPLRVDAASPLTSYLLGPEWYPSDGDHRWMPRRATLRMGAPADARPEALSARQLPGRATQGRTASRDGRRWKA